MATKAQTSSETTLQLKRRFAAPRDRVFRAWTEAGDLANWFGPTDEYATVVPQLDLRVGGAYCFEMHHKGGNVHKVGGVYREIRPPEKIAFTWRWEGDPSQHESLVTVEFLDLGLATEVTITHENLPDADGRDRHMQGWVGCTGRLAKQLEEAAGSAK